MTYSRREVVDNETVVDKDHYDNLQDGIDEALKGNRDAKSYTDQQIALVTSTGIPKLVIDVQPIVAESEGQTEFEITLETYDERTDSVLFFSGLTKLSPNKDYTVEGNKVILKRGLPKGRTGDIYIFKNVPMGEDGSVTGKVIAQGTLPLDRLERFPTANEVGARPNQNLLHNWYFGNPINRNGKTEYTKEYTIDRWKTEGKATLNDDGTITVTNPYAYDIWAFYQLVKNIPFETVTASILVKEVIGSANFVMQGTADGIYDNMFSKSVKVGLMFATAKRSDGNFPEYRFGFVLKSGASVTLELGAKLELGDTQTLAHQDENGNWVLNEIPDYAEQMAICMQYDKSSGAYIGESLPANSVGGVHNVRTFSYIDQLGLTDDDMSATNFLANIQKINEANSTPFIALLYPNSDYPNLRDSISAKLLADLGTDKTSDTLITLQIRRSGNKYAPLLIDVTYEFYASGSIGTIYSCVVNLNSSTYYISPFTKSVHPTGFLPLDGSVPMSGVLKLLNDYIRITGSETVAQIEIRNVAGDDKNRRLLTLTNSTGESNISNALKIVEVINGVVGDRSYYIFGEHNYKDYVLPLDGSVPMKVLIDILGSDNAIKATVGTSVGSVAAYLMASKDVHRAQLLMNPVEKWVRFVTSADSGGTWKGYDIFHAGNKPLGEYTGNGSATKRTIDTGGLGNIVLIMDSVGHASLVMPWGAICKQNTGNVTALQGSNCSFNNGVIEIATTDANVNQNGVTYYYQVL